MTLDELLRELLATGKVKVEITLSLIEHDESPAHPEFVAKCDKCGWKSKPLSSEGAKVRSLRSHIHHCTGTADHPEWLVEQMKTKNQQ